MVTAEQRIRLQRRADRGPPPYVWDRLEEIAERSITERLGTQSAVGAFLDYYVNDVLDTRAAELQKAHKSWRKLLRRQVPGETRNLISEQSHRLKDWWRSVGRTWWREQGIMVGALRPRGRPSVVGLDRLIWSLDRIFPDLECRRDPWQRRYSGRLVELVYEVLRQTKPILLIGGIQLNPIDVARWKQNPDDKQAELNYIGRRIKEVRRRTRK